MFRYLFDLIWVIVEDIKEISDHLKKLACYSLNIAIIRNEHKLNIPDCREDEIKEKYITDSSVISKCIHKARHIHNSNILSIYCSSNHVWNLCF